MRAFRFRPRSVPGTSRVGWRATAPCSPELLSTLLFLAACVVIRVWLRTWHRLTIEGRENLPSRGSYVLVANHSSHLDALCLMAALPFLRLGSAHPAAAADYFFRRSAIAALSILLLNALPFVRGEGSRHSIEQCRRLLARRRRVLILFPEGSRSATGWPRRFRTGIGRIVAGSEAAVVPCYLDGADRAWPKGRLLPRPHRVRLSIGVAQRFDRVARDRAGAACIAGRLESAVQRLGGRSRRASRHGPR